VIKLGELVMILDLHRQGLSVSAIARQVGVDRKTVRTRRLQGYVPQKQRRAGVRRGLMVTVFEARAWDGAKFHAHVVAIMPDADARDRLIGSLGRSSVYGGYVDAGPVYDWNRLTGYLLKEATVQAWFAAGKSFRRIKGSIPPPA
jgi:hypothetical protein